MPDPPVRRVAILIRTGATVALQQLAFFPSHPRAFSRGIDAGP